MNLLRFSNGSCLSKKHPVGLIPADTDDRENSRSRSGRKFCGGYTESDSVCIKEGSISRYCP